MINIGSGYNFRRIKKLLDDKEWKVKKEKRRSFGFGTALNHPCGFGYIKRAKKFFGVL